ncbi:MFS transporter, partial [Paucibacter sp. XJ19-41]|nr:MFS transporter [Paucibacter sp. XJ19-41]
LLVAAGWLPPLVAAAATALAGFGTGLAGPSRDMLIKRAAPPGATGRVYGTVYSGLDVGFALAAPVFGALLDGGHPAGVFAGSAAALGLGIASAGLVGLRIARTQLATA